MGKPKVEVAARILRSVRGDIEAEPLIADVLRASDAARLLDCDLIFCCTDSHGSRAVLNQLSYQYMIHTAHASGLRNRFGVVPETLLKGPRPRLRALRH